MVEEIVIEEVGQTTIQDLLGNKLVVYNDDVNSFEWVIECLIKYLEMSTEQAEQCALLIHNKGRYAVKWGTQEELEPFKVALNDAGLSSEIE